MNEVLALLKELFLQFSVRRLMLVAFLVALIVVGFLALENVTGYSFFGKTERRVNLLKELHALAKDGIADDPELAPIYYDIVSDLAGYPTGPIQLPLSFELGGVWRLISGAAIGLIFILYGLSERRKGTASWTATVTIGSVFGIMFGIVGFFIPTLYNPWINYIGFPLVQFLLLWALATMTSRKRVRREQAGVDSL